ncbi:helix-turn-helix domain-containing protein [Bradyrhizobium barranii]
MDGRGETNGPKDAPAIEADDAVDQRLGETVRLLRQRAGLSIQDVATKTGLSNGMISQLERARAMPSIRTLRLLSIALDVPISYFFETTDPADVQRYIVRKNSRRLLRLTASGVVKEALTPADQGQLELYELTLNPGRLVRHRLLAAHRREGRLHPLRQPAAVARQPGSSARGWRQFPFSEHRAAHVRQPDSAGRACDLGHDAAPDRFAGRLSARNAGAPPEIAPRRRLAETVADVKPEQSTARTRGSRD